MKFISSKKELHRRKIAFISLSVGLLVGVLTAGLLFSTPFVFTIVSVLIALLLIICALTFRYLNALVGTEILIQDGAIERRRGRSIERYVLSDLRSLKIKRRTNGAIRELYLSFRDGMNLYINAFEESFESIKRLLVDARISVKEVREPMDFDHPLFYPILGLLVGGGASLFFKAVLSMNASGLRVLMMGFSVYLLALAGYFLFKHPISIRSGKDDLVADRVFGIGMIVASVLMALVGWRAG